MVCPFAYALMSSFKETREILMSSRFGFLIISVFLIIVGFITCSVGMVQAKAQGIQLYDTKNENNEIIAKGPISLDLTGKKSGRGAYICKSASCLKKARKATQARFFIVC